MLEVAESDFAMGPRDVWPCSDRCIAAGHIEPTGRIDGFVRRRYKCDAYCAQWLGTAREFDSDRASDSSPGSFDALITGISHERHFSLFVVGDRDRRVAWRWLDPGESFSDDLGRTLPVAICLELSTHFSA